MNVTHPKNRSQRWFRYSRITPIFCFLAIFIFSTCAFGTSFNTHYQSPRSQSLQLLSENLKNGLFLEKLGISLERQISLPTPITLALAECGNANAFYSPQLKSITICYELFSYLQKGIQSDFQGIATQDEVKNSIVGAIYFVLMHEMGHALIDVLDIPVLGREEDAADQISTFFMLRLGEHATDAISGAIFFFKQKQIFYTRVHFSDEHSLGPQRQSNIACWEYGSNPTKYEYLIQGGLITRNRAARCPGEYIKLDTSVRQLLGSHLR